MTDLHCLLLLILPLLVLRLALLTAQALVTWMEVRKRDV